MYKIVSHSNQCYRIVHADVDRHRRGDLHHGRVRVRVSHLRMRVRHLRIDIISIIGFPPSPICIFQIMSEFEVYSRWFRQPPNVTPEHTHSFLYVRSFFGIGKYALTHADSGQPVSKKNQKDLFFSENIDCQQITCACVTCWLHTCCGVTWPGGATNPRTKYCGSANGGWGPLGPPYCKRWVNKYLAVRMHFYIFLPYDLSINLNTKSIMPQIVSVKKYLLNLLHLQLVDGQRVRVERTRPDGTACVTYM